MNYLLISDISLINFVLEIGVGVSRQIIDLVTFITDFNTFLYLSVQIEPCGKGISDCTCS